MGYGRVAYAGPRNRRAVRWVGRRPSDIRDWVEGVDGDLFEERVAEIYAVGVRSFVNYESIAELAWIVCRQAGSHSVRCRGDQPMLSTILIPTWDGTSLPALVIMMHFVQSVSSLDISGMEAIMANPPVICSAGRAHLPCEVKLMSVSKFCLVASPAPSNPRCLSMLTGMPRLPLTANDSAMTAVASIVLWMRADRVPLEYERVLVKKCRCA